MTLATALSLALTLSSCATRTQTAIEIPELHIEVERPVLEAIPELDVEGWTETQIQAVTGILSVYNMNMGRLAIYAQSLEKAYAVKVEYLNNVLQIIVE